MRTTDLKATAYAIIIALAVASGLVLTVIRSSQASHRGAVVAVAVQSHPITAGGVPDNNPWD
jgi:hypothetical protein